MNAIPPGLVSPVTIGVTDPVVRSVCPTNAPTTVDPPGVVTDTMAEYAAPGAKYGAVIA